MVETLVNVSQISFADLEFMSFGAKVRVDAHRPFLVCDPSVKRFEYAESIFLCAALFGKLRCIFCQE
jgi:hypothetical protein